MGIRQLTYRDIPLALRAQKVGEAERRLQAILGDPAMPEQQRAAARRQQAVLRHWAAGTLPTQTEGPLDYQALVATLDAPDTLPSQAPPLPSEDDEAIASEPPSEGPPSEVPESRDHVVEVDEEITTSES